MGDLRLVMLITVIWPLNIGGYSGQDLEHTVLGNGLRTMLQKRTKL